MKLPLALALALACAAGCDRCGKSAPGAAKRPATLDPWDPLPPRVAEAMALRGKEGPRALALLNGVWADAVAKGDVRTAAIALHRSGDLSADQLQKVEARAFYLRAVALYQLSGEQALLGLVANDLGLLSRGRGNEPIAWFDYSARVRREIGDVAGLRTALGNQGGFQALNGYYAESIPVLNEALALAEQLEDLDGQRRAHVNLALAWLEASEDDQAEPWPLDAGLGPRTNAMAHLRTAIALSNRVGKDPYPSVCRAAFWRGRPICAVLGVGIRAAEDPDEPEDTNTVTE